MFFDSCHACHAGSGRVAIAVRVCPRVMRLWGVAVRVADGVGPGPVCVVTVWSSHGEAVEWRSRRVQWGGGHIDGRHTQLGRLYF